LFAAFSIYNKMYREYQAHASLNLPLMCGEFEAKLKILYGRMALEVINVLEPFLGFVVTFNAATAHIMCSLQLDPRFKGLQCIMEYVGKDKTTATVEEYDHQVLMPLLVVISKHLNFGNVETFFLR
jgi:hypothetical protein